LKIEFAFIIYLIFYRIAIIVAGIWCITLGYRLFCKGVWPHTEKNNNSEFSAEFDKVKFNFKNAAPGSLFAFFGIILIVSMIINGSPELTIKTLNKGNIKDNSSNIEADNQELYEQNFSLRGDTQTKTNYDDIIKLARQFENNKQNKESIKHYKESLAIATEAMNGLAWQYFVNYSDHDQYLNEALLLSQMAVKYKPDEANYLDTLAEILFKKGEYNQALAAKNKSISLDSRFSNNIEKFKNAVK